MPDFPLTRNRNLLARWSIACPHADTLGNPANPESS
jgi:hypothetical protein